MQNSSAAEPNSRSVQIAHQLEVDLRNHPHPELSGDLDLRLQLLSRLDSLLGVENLVVYRLHKDSSISEWKINGTHIFGRPNRKITGINSLLQKVVLFDRLERFKRFISFHLHFFWIVVLVPNKFIICFYSFRSYGKWKARTPNEIFQLTFLRPICTISNQMVFSCKW